MTLQHVLRRVGAGAGGRVAGQVPRRHDRQRLRDRHRARPSPRRGPCGIIVGQLVSLKLLDTSPKPPRLPFQKKAPATLAVPPDLRMQLDSAGHHGGQVHLDRLLRHQGQPAAGSPLSPCPTNYVPAAASTMKNLEDSVTKALSRFPEIADQTVLAISRVNHMLAVIDDEKLPQQAGTALSRAGVVLSLLQTSLRQADIGSWGSTPTRPSLPSGRHRAPRCDARSRWGESGASS